jgi:hypothetical protein
MAVVTFNFIMLPITHAQLPWLVTEAEFRKQTVNKLNDDNMQQL